MLALKVGRVERDRDARQRCGKLIREFSVLEGLKAGGDFLVQLIHFGLRRLHVRRKSGSSAHGLAGAGALLIATASNEADCKRRNTCDERVDASLLGGFATLSVDLLADLNLDGLCLGRGGHHHSRRAGPKRRDGHARGHRNGRGRSSRHRRDYRRGHSARLPDGNRRRRGSRCLSKAGFEIDLRFLGFVGHVAVGGDVSGLGA